MSIIIFGDTFTFPDGNAATNRVHTYAKGFHENGMNVHVICFASRYNTSGDGITNGIQYYHPFGQRRRSNYFLFRQWYKLSKYFKTILLIRRINKFDKVNAVNCWSSKLHTLFFAFFFSKFVDALIVHEHSEHPLRNYQNSVYRKIRGELKSYIGTKLSDGFFCISQYLIDFYQSRGVKSKNMLLVPSTVDTDRFSDFYEPPFSFEYILYCGSLTELKDGVHILIESFGEISEKYPYLKLVLIGKGNSTNDEMSLKRLVDKLDLNQKILFLGQVSRTQVPKYMTNAKILALARPSSLVADAGFPSKLTEYLSTGLPVVITDVGEISLYLRDNENVFLSKPDSVEAFANKLDFVLENYSFAQVVSFKGRELTKTMFNYNIQAKRMIEFIDKFK